MTSNYLEQNVVFFFGAGASAAEGAPIASRLLTDAFQEFPNDGRVNRVKEFLKDWTGPKNVDS